MGDITLHRLDDAMLAELSDLASINHVSLEEQATKLLVSAVEEHSRRRRRYETAKRIAAMTPAGVTPTDSVLLLREDRAR